MKTQATRLSLAASVAFAVIAATSIVPASAQSTTYPAGTDCSRLVGNSKTACANQAKMTSAPDNSNNPSMSPDDDSGVTSNTGTTMSNDAATMGTTTNTTSEPASDYYPQNSRDCAKLVGNSKTECAAKAKDGPSPDNSNNPDQQN
jgi:hypothetical protein